MLALLVETSEHEETVRFVASRIIIATVLVVFILALAASSYFNSKDKKDE